MSYFNTSFYKCVWLYIHIYVVVCFGVWLSLMLESLLYLYLLFFNIPNCSKLYLFVFL